MKMRNIYMISVLIIAFAGIGCVDKNIQQANSGELPTVTTAVENPTAISGPAAPEINNGPIEKTEDNSSTTDGNNGSIEPTNDNTTEIIGDNTTIDNVSTNDTSVTEIFKIGEEKKILDKNIKLINITDYDNNTVLLSIDGVEYQYSSENSSIQASNIQVIDIITSVDEQTAEITVDYIK
jgi:hypothetical protein